MFKAEITILILFVGALAMIAYVLMPVGPSREELRSLCAQQGGISVVGDHGGYKICLNPDAVIELPKQ
jgi:hypothetical protein